MSAVDARTGADVDEPFPSLAALRSAHAELFEARRANGHAPELTDRTIEFVQRAVLSGTLLDSDADRDLAQSLVDSWVATLFREKVDLPDTMLADFDPALAPELPNDPCPYRGLDAFGEAQHSLFFGRRRVVTEWLGLLRKQRFLAVIGSSGSGKSSLVQGGVIPALKAGSLPGSDGWHYLPPMVPGSHPLETLARLVRPVDLAGPDWVAEQAAGLRARPDHLRGLVEARTDAPVVLVIDQFEELFTLCLDDEARQAFGANLAELVTAPGTRHTVIITLRTDFETNVARVPALLPLVQANQARVPALSAVDLREAIEEPAALVGLRFEAGIVDALIGEILGEPVGLPLLQFTLLRLWNMRVRNRVTWEAYRALGGPRQALARTADAFYESLIPQHQDTVQRILLRMVGPTEGLEVMSRRVRRAALYQAGEASDRIDLVLGRLIEERFVKLTQGDTPDDDQVEVAHEALIRNWQRLVNWLEDDRARLRRRLRLTVAAREWEAAGRDPDALLRGAVLEEAERQEDLDELEAALVQASRRAIEEAERHEIEAALQLAEAERARAEAATELAETRRKNVVRHRILEAALAVCLLLAMVAVAIAVRAERESRANAVAAHAVAEAAVDPELGISLALLAADLDRTPQVEQALRRIVSDSSRRAPFAQHQGSLWSAHYSPDGSHVATASRDGTAMLWPVNAPDRAVTLRGHTKPVYRMAFSPDGSRLVTASADGTARLWDGQSGAPILTLPDNQGEVIDVQFSPDGSLVASVGADGRTLIWDVHDAAHVPPALVLCCHEKAIWALDFDPSGQRLVTAGNDGTARVWDVRSGQELLPPLVHEKSVESAEFSPDGAWIVTASKDQTAVIWDAATGKPRHTLTGHTEFVWRAVFNPAGTLVATVSADGSARIWDVATGALRSELRGHAGPIYRAEFSADGTRLVTASQDWTARVWEIAHPIDPVILRGHTGLVRSARFSLTGDQVVTASDDGTARVWDVPRGRYLAGHADWVNVAHFSADGRAVVTGSDDGTVRLWSVETSQETAPAFEHASSITDVQFLPDQSRFVIGTSAGLLMLWDARLGTADVLGRHDPDQDGVAAVASVSVHPDGDRVLTAGRDGTIRVWSVGERRQLRTIGEPSGRVFGAVFSPDGRWIASSHVDTADLRENGFWATGTSVIRLWDAESGALVRELRGHTLRVLDLAFSPDSRRLATASDDRTARLWDVASGETLWTFGEHSAEVVSVAFSADGQQLITAGWDRTAIIWDVASGQYLRRLGGHAGFLNSAAFSPDGTRVLTTSNDRTAQLQPSDCRGCGTLDRVIASARERGPRPLTPDERRRFMDSEPNWWSRLASLGRAVIGTI